MKKELLLVILLAIVFSSVGVHAVTTGLVSPANPGHNSSQVFLSVGGGKYITLQNAIDNGFFIAANTSLIPTTLLPVSSPYEFASQIIITLGGYNVTLQDAVNYQLFATPANSQSYAKSSIPAGGEYASKINVNTTSSIKTLQYTIDNNLLSSIPPILSCPTGYTCPSGFGIGSACYPTSGGSLGCAGTINSNRACASFSIGYTCGGVYTKGCDGSGRCVGYSGNGCGGCPFGTTSDGAGDTLCINRAGGLLYTAHPADASYASGVNYCGTSSTAPICQVPGSYGSHTDSSWILYPCAFG